MRRLPGFALCAGQQEALLPEAGSAILYGWGKHMQRAPLSRPVSLGWWMARQFIAVSGELVGVDNLVTEREAERSKIFD